jgi:hypothetical protein
MSDPSASLYNLRAYLAKTLDNIEDSTRGWSLSDVRTFITDALDLDDEDEHEALSGNGRTADYDANEAAEGRFYSTPERPVGAESEQGR